MSKVISPRFAMLLVTAMFGAACTVITGELPQETPGGQEASSPYGEPDSSAAGSAGHAGSSGQAGASADAGDASRDSSTQPDAFYDVTVDFRIDNALPDASFEGVELDTGLEDVSLEDSEAEEACVASLEEGVEACSDGLDNDCDGQKDCADLGCDQVLRTYPNSPLTARCNLSPGTCYSGVECSEFVDWGGGPARCWQQNGGSWSWIPLDDPTNGFACGVPGFSSECEFRCCGSGSAVTWCVDGGWTGDPGTCEGADAASCS